MREITIARSYAETLVELAQRAGDLDGWGAMIDEVAGAIAADPRLVRFLQTPRVSARQNGLQLLRLERFLFEQRFGHQADGFGVLLDDPLRAQGGRRTVRER